mmetsp:Transcript_21606/g.31436  ORF Transcript_21606/g.31436 Transcript_21606/m.31436 type:complete len:256 (+) Transcript_21606:37-804(+)
MLGRCLCSARRQLSVHHRSVSSKVMSTGEVVLDNSAVHIVRKAVGPFAMNEYLLVCKKTKQAALIDSGESPENYFEGNSGSLPFNITHLLQTHAHVDHVAGLRSTKSKFSDARIYIHKDEMPVYDQVGKQARMFGVPCELPLPSVDELIDEGMTIQVGALKFEIIFTPGHSPGGCVFFHNDVTYPFAFVGDLIFRNSIGRTDLPGSDPKLMKSSICKIVNMLPPKTLLLPGHMDVTFMSKERASNPFVLEWVGRK